MAAGPEVEFGVPSSIKEEKQEGMALGASIFGIRSWIRLSEKAALPFQVLWNSTPHVQSSSSAEISLNPWISVSMDPQRETSNVVELNTSPQEIVTCPLLLWLEYFIEVKGMALKEADLGFSQILTFAIWKKLCFRRESRNLFCWRGQRSLSGFIQKVDSRKVERGINFSE